MPAVGRGAPKCCQSPTGEKPRGEDRSEALPIFIGPPSVDGVVWSDRRRNHHEDPPHGPCRRGGRSPQVLSGTGTVPPGATTRQRPSPQARARDDGGPTHGQCRSGSGCVKTTPRRMRAPTHDDESDDDAHQGARQRPPRATKAARRTGVDEAAFTSTMDDAEDDDVDDADDDVERGAKLRAAGKADEYGARRVRAATTPHDSDDDPYDSATRSRSQGRPTRPTRQRGTTRGADAWRSPTRARWQCDRDCAMLRRRDGKVTATAAMVGATAPRQHRRNCGERRRNASPTAGRGQPPSWPRARKPPG